MGKYQIDAYVEMIRGDRAGDRSDKIEITASYEAASILSSLTFQVPILEANRFYIGQKIAILVTW